MQTEPATDLIDDAALDAALAEEAEQNETNEEEQSEQPPQPNETPNVEMIDLDGELIPKEQLKTERMLHADYTRKTQAVAEERKQVEQLMQFQKAWDEHPHLRPQLAAAFVEAAGVQPAPTTQSAQPSGSLLDGYYDPSDPTPEWQQRGYDSPGELKIAKEAEARFQALSQTLAPLQQFVETQTRTAQQNAQAAEAANRLASYGFAGVTIDQLNAAVAMTGIPDHEAAFLKANAQQIASKMSAPKPAETKPQAPTAQGGRFFDPNDPTLNADDFERLIKKGFMPLQR